MWRRQARAIAGAIILGVGIGAFIGSAPAAAGAWATTVLDPLPRIEAGRTYNVTFWVLQHGTHPYDWQEPAEIGRVALTLVDAGGRSVSFPGRELAEPAHYAAVVTVPRAGTWRVVGEQGVFMSFLVGTLTVPGKLVPLGVPAAPSAEDLQRYWPGPVRPPVLPIDHGRDPFLDAAADAVAPTANDPTAAAAPIDVPAADGRGGAAVPAAGARTGPVRSPVVVGFALAALGLALAAGRRWRRTG